MNTSEHFLRNKLRNNPHFPWFLLGYAPWISEKPDFLMAIRAPSKGARAPLRDNADPPNASGIQRNFHGISIR